MPPVVRGDIWPLFVREENLVYNRAFFYARCRGCTEAISLGVGTTLQQKLTGSPLDIAGVRAQAKELGLVIGRDRSMIPHMRTCRGIASVDKANAEAYCTSKGQPTAVVTPPKSAVASCAGAASAKPHQSAYKRLKATSIAEYAAFGNRFRHDPDVHARLIANLVSVHKVQFAVLSSIAFRELQDYYLGSVERTAKSGLVIFHAKIRTKFLPLRFEEAVERCTHSSAGLP
jgi:hypothetical protein